MSQKLTLEQDKVKLTVFDMIKWGLLKEKRTEMLSVLEFYKECSNRQTVWKVYFVVLRKLKAIFQAYIDKKAYYERKCRELFATVKILARFKNYLKTKVGPNLRQR